MEETILNSNDRETGTEIEIEIETEFCSICLNDDLIDEDTYITDCSHTFCKICLDNWFQRGNNNCPLCRNVINSYNSDGLRYHLVIHSIPNETINNHRESLNISGLDMQNYRLKKFILCMIVPLILLFQYNIELSYKYDNLLYDYNFCIKNSSRLIDNLNMCLNTVQEGGDPGTYVSVADGYEMKECFIPYRYYFQCFYE